ncbi:MAG: SHOCT domain-containing protein [Rhodospirillaceae bacterium]
MVRIAVSIIAAALLSGCANNQKAAESIDSNYKTVLTPPPGLARVYVFSPMKPTMLMSFTANGSVYVGASEATSFKAGETSAFRFVAFDARPGNLYIKWSSGGGEATSQAKTFQLTSGQTLLLQPMNTASSLNSVPMLGLVGALANAAIAAGTTPEGNFTYLTVEQAQDLMKDKSVVSILPEASSYVQQGVAANASSGKLNLTKQTESIESERVGVQPSQVDTSGSSESQLTQLKRLKDKGLITKADYDEKKKQILERIN